MFIWWLFNKREMHNSNETNICLMITAIIWNSKDLSILADIQLLHKVTKNIQILIWPSKDKSSNIK